MSEHAESRAQVGPRTPTRVQAGLRRLWRVILGVLGAFVILEPLWMLLPFAGFLYGSVFHIQTLSQRPGTAWLTHFVFPVLTLGVLGPILVLAGLLVFLVGAVQIYWAKFRKTGLVTRGLYRFVRHPQYTALTVFGFGLLLAWGRALAFVAYFAMLFLYYQLGKSEERRCERLFGEEYREYARRTSFVLPGDRRFAGMFGRLRLARLPSPARFVLGLVVTVVACFATYSLVNAVKASVRTVPYLTAEITVGPSMAPGSTSEVIDGLPLVRRGRLAVVRGPYRNAAAPGFAERVLARIPGSAALEEFLSLTRAEGGDFAVAFCLPFSQPKRPGPPTDTSPRRGPPLDPAGPDRVRLLIFHCRPEPGAPSGGILLDKSKRTILGARIAPVNLGTPAESDLVEGDVFRPGPRFPGEERWDHVISQLRARPVPPARRTASGDSGPARLVLVKAPILRTRLDPGFAAEILVRLTGSAAFRAHIEKTGAGGSLVPVAFPRPGPNWYSEHRGKPVVSVFVVLAELDSEDPEDLFRPDRRRLLGAFTAEMDFKIAADEDSLSDFVTIGPRRDLEERWAFFLSGL